MNPFDLPLLATIVDHAATALLRLADLLDPFAGPASAALAIVLATALVRTALVPLGVAQARADRDRRRLAPRVARIRERYRDQPERLQAELRSSTRPRACRPRRAASPPSRRRPCSRSPTRRSCCPRSRDTRT
ncbi:hypothetical protein GCM10025877_32810 [Agromyces mangrovi Wang et al. 2018]|nr:YidC/Oxa1 family membrane protein insertase [Agromyces mangrovi]BDZ66343.1 hypothetical protein GCM10025877_32810 [Agromyces mangrovi]